MSITITLYETNGLVAPTLTVVENIGWKSSATNEDDHYVYSPIIRPQDGIAFSYGVKKYNYMKIEGAYPIGSRPRIKLEGDYNGTRPDGYEGEGDIRIYYKLTNVYEPPSNAYDADMMYLVPGETKILYPTVSTSGPGENSNYLQYLQPDTTYYTQYLVTQVVLPAGTGYGNIGELNIEWYMDEYEDTNI